MRDLVACCQVDASSDSFLRKFALFSTPTNWQLIMAMLACPAGTASAIELDAAAFIQRVRNMLRMSACAFVHIYMCVLLLCLCLDLRGAHEVCE